jgi:hypothetical protein
MTALAVNTLPGRAVKASSRREGLLNALVLYPARLRRARWPADTGAGPQPRDVTGLCTASLTQIL